MPLPAIAVPKGRAKIVLGISLPLLAADQLTKIWAIENLRATPPRSFLGDLFRLQYAENPGAFLSLGSALSHDSRFWILTVAVGLFLLGSMGYLLISRTLHRFSVIGLALVVSGGLSNLIDRAFRPGGRVIDFMNMGIQGLRTGIFNIADMAIVAGIGLLVLATFVAPDAEGPESSGAPLRGTEG